MSVFDSLVQAPEGLGKLRFAGTVSVLAALGGIRRSPGSSHAGHTSFKNIYEFWNLMI